MQGGMGSCMRPRRRTLISLVREEFEGIAARRRIDLNGRTMVIVAARDRDSLQLALLDRRGRIRIPQDIPDIHTASYIRSRPRRMGHEITEEASRRANLTLRELAERRGIITNDRPMGVLQLGDELYLYQVYGARRAIPVVIEGVMLPERGFLNRNRRRTRTVA